MAPEHISGNMWQLLEGEEISGITPKGVETLHGPQIVRVHEFEDLNALRIQGSSGSIEIEGTDFESKVRKI